jgi:hypothetical protein
LICGLKRLQDLFRQLPELAKVGLYISAIGQGQQKFFVGSNFALDSSKVFHEFYFGLAQIVVTSAIESSLN